MEQAAPANDSDGGFNRTFMELKSADGQRRNRPTGCFNRTFMELKSLNCTANDAANNCFNRTFMELKLHREEVGILRCLRVLIVPLWN